MANHSYVRTKTKMDHSVIDEILTELNKKLFKGNLKVEYHRSNDAMAWGPHTWLIAYMSEGKEMVTRVCWLRRGGRTFEMRHGGGFSFGWWIDFAISNEVAVRYDGTISDDGVGEKWKGEVGKYKSYKRFARKMNRNNDAIRELEKSFTPKEFW